MRRGFKALLGVLSLLLVLGLVVVGLLGSEAGSRWLLGRVPGLQVEGFTGRLAGQWQADRLVWQRDQDRVEVRGLRLDWSAACLLRLTLCLERLEVEQLSLAFAPDPTAAQEPYSLPELNLPLAVELGELRIGRLLLDGDEQLSGLQLAAHWRGEHLEITRLSLHREDLGLELQGRVQPGGGWPLALEGSIQLPTPEGQPWSLALTLEGELRDRLQLTADSSGYLHGKLTGELQPLAVHLPARLHLVAEAFTASAALPATLRLEQLDVTAAGDLMAGYEVLGSAKLPAEGGAIALGLQGQATAQGAQIAALSLSAGPRQRVELRGELDWQTGLAGHATLDWQDFPWRRLYPDLDEPPVALRRLSAEVDYRDGDYLGHFAADLDGPAGALSLTSPVSGDLTQAHLPDLLLQAGQGRASGRLTLGFAEGLRWDTDLTLSDLDPAYWLAELPGRLAGPLRSQGRFDQGQLALSAEVKLAGQLRGQPAVFAVQAEGEGEAWNLAELDLRLGANRVQGQARLDQALAGRLELALPRLGQLWPGLAGRLEGRLDLAGTLNAPQGHLSLAGQRLALDDLGLAALTLSVSLDAQQRGHLDLAGQALRFGDSDLGALKLSGQGDRQRQRLDLGLDGPRLELALGLDGGFEQGVWRGHLGRGQVRSGSQDWRLAQPATLERLVSGQISLGAHCWRAASASLCGQAQPLFPQPNLDYRLRDFPLASLGPWLPADFAWQGQLNGELRLELAEAGPSGQIRLDAGPGVLRLREGQQWLDFPYDRLELDSALAPRRIDSRLSFSGPQLGELQAQAQLDPGLAGKPLQGRFSLRGLDLALARPFVPQVETLAGRLDGSGSLGGSLLAPRVEGRLSLADGQIAGGELPSAVEDLQLQAAIAGERLQLEGSWRSGEQGRGSLSGWLEWAEALAFDLRLRGTRLPLSIEPYGQLEVEPDLSLRLDDGNLALTGQVAVPRGRIEIRELPPSTVKVSEDVVKVGAQTEQGEARRKIAMDVAVDVGGEGLSFSGFGLSADLAGHLKIGDNLDTRGELNLNNGRYRAYGQRLTIRRARLLFAGPLDQPYLDIEAIRRVDQVVAGLRLTGNLEQPTSEVFSEPAMGQEQALSYLVLGRPLSGAEGDNNLLGQAALALGLAGSASLTGGLAKRLGIRDFQLDTEGSGLTTSVVARGKLSERLSLRYGVGVFEPANTIALRYELSKRWYLEAASGLASSLDIFYKRDF